MRPALARSCRDPRAAPLAHMHAPQGNVAITGVPYDGIGVVLGEGSSRLLADYPPKQQSEILDLLCATARGRPRGGRRAGRRGLVVRSVGALFHGSGPAFRRATLRCFGKRAAALAVASYSKAGSGAFPAPDKL